MKVLTKLKLAALRYNNWFRRRPLVLNIELSHECNLRCAFCGRVRNKSKGKVSIEKAKTAIDQVDSAIVYLTGGEPFVHPEELAEVAEYALKNNKIVIIVTNGTLLPIALDHFNISDKKNLILMFSIDGLEKTNDEIRGKGSFDRMEKGLHKAKDLGYNVWMNYTVYTANMHEFEDTLKYFGKLVDRFHLNLYFDFTGNTPQIKELGTVADKAIALRKRHHILNPVLYFRFWKGFELDCTPWGTVTLDPSGWKSPCYFCDETHYETYGELMRETDWTKFVKKESPQCINCKAHCGFEPTIYRKKWLLLREVLKI